jgi:MFS family permease
VVWVLLRNMRGQTSGGLTMAAYAGSLRKLTQNRPLLTILVATGGFTIVQTAVGTFLPVYLRNDLGYQQVETGLLLAAAQVGGIVSQPVMGFLSDRFGRQGVLVPALVFLGVGVLAVGTVPAGWPLVVSVVFMGAFQFPLMALFLASAMDIVGQEVQATTVSLVFGAGSIFGSFSPALAGLLADRFGVQAVFLYGAAVAVLAAALLLLGPRHARQD